LGSAKQQHNIDRTTIRYRNKKHNSQKHFKIIMVIGQNSAVILEHKQGVIIEKHFFIVRFKIVLKIKLTLI